MQLLRKTGTRAVNIPAGREGPQKAPSLPEELLAINLVTAGRRESPFPLRLWPLGGELCSMLRWKGPHPEGLGSTNWTQCLVRHKKM